MVVPNSSRRNEFSQSESLEKARERIYEREEIEKNKSRTSVPRYVRRQIEEEELPEAWQYDSNRTQEKEYEKKETMQSVYVEPQVPKRSYRKYIILFGVAIFMIIVSVASLFLVFGNKNISGENIKIETTGPYAVNGGDEISFSVTVANNNPVSVTDATLIVSYPKGTAVNGVESKERTVEKQQISQMKAGEVVNVPLKARLFGEENEDKTIEVSIEYRVEGSDALFTKNSEPYKIKISSSPVVISTESVSSITSGEEYTLTIKVISNSAQDITNLLIESKYPAGFEFVSSDPKPVAGKSVWKIDTLKPGEKQNITIKGRLAGEQGVTQAIDISAGFSNTTDTQKVTSLVSTARVPILIEAPFLKVDIQANGKSGEVYTAGELGSVSYTVNIENPLLELIRDATVEVVLSGNAFDETSVQSFGGTYNIRTKTVTFDSASNSELSSIGPGERRSVTFSVSPTKKQVKTPEIVAKANLKAVRVLSQSSSQNLTAADSMVVRFGSSFAGASTLEHVSGPQPPRVNEETKYRATFNLEAGGNDVRDATLTATLPTYITVSESLPTNVAYNKTKRQLTWNAGTIFAGKNSTISVEVSIIPSTTDVGNVPVIIPTQQITATDRFTEEVITQSLNPLTTDIGESSESGAVQN